MLELDHVICFAPARDALDLEGFTIEPGRVHVGQGTRNVRVLFERSYLEVVWVEHPDQVAARGLDFVGRCARPSTGYPFGVVLRGTIPLATRAQFAPYELPDAPGVVLQVLVEQPPGAAFVAVFEAADPAGMWPARRIAAGDGADYFRHACGATRLIEARLTCPMPPPVDGLDDVDGVRFALGSPRLDLDLGVEVRAFVP